MEVITFNELRQIKDQLPDGAMELIAAELNLSPETVRNAFGASNYKTGESVGLHIEKGPDGGLVTMDHPEILHCAKKLLESKN